MRQMDILGTDFLCSHNVQGVADVWFLGEKSLNVERWNLYSQTGLQTCSRTWKLGSWEEKARQGKRQGCWKGPANLSHIKLTEKKWRIYLLFFNVYEYFTCVCVYAHVCAWWRGLQSHKRALDPLAMEWTVPTWLLVADLGSSARAAVL